MTGVIYARYSSDNQRLKPNYLINVIQSHYLIDDGIISLLNFLTISSAYIILI